MAPTLAAVSTDVGELTGCMKKSTVLCTAVAPKLVPSSQASR